MKGKSVPTSKPEEKLFSRVLSYAVHPPGTVQRKGYQAGKSKRFSRLLVRTALELVRREPMIFQYGIAVARNSAGNAVLEYPTVFVNTHINQKTYVKLRYDPLTFLTPQYEGLSPISKIELQATGRPVERIDDVVGDLPSTLGATVSLCYYLNIMQTTKDRKYLQNIDNLGDLILAKDGPAPYAKYVGLVRDLRARPPDVTQCIGDNMEELQELFSSYLRVWLELISRLGVYSVDFWQEHGMG